MSNTKSALVDLEQAVLERLQSLNHTIEQVQIAAFYLVEDDLNSEELMADTIWVSTETNSMPDMAFLDNCCRRAGEATSDLVTWVHCIYRTEREFHRDYGSVAWQNRLIFVDDRFRQSSAA
jgi:hypothetical protein